MLVKYIYKFILDRDNLMTKVAIAFIGLAVDNLIRTWANKRKKLLGLEEY